MVSTTGVVFVVIALVLLVLLIPILEGEDFTSFGVDLQNVFCRVGIQNVMGQPVLKCQNSNDIINVIQGNGMIITTNATGNTINFTSIGGVDNHGVNLGAGAGIYKGQVGADLGLRSIIGTGGITATQNTNDITLNLSNIPKTAIAPSGQFTWDNVSKSGSNLNDIGSPIASFDFAGHHLTNLGTASSATDAANAGHLGLLGSLATGTCANNQVLQYQTGNSTWICSSAGSGTVSSINGNGNAAQTIAGTANNVTVTDAGATHTLNLGSNVVTTGGQPQVVTKGITANSLTLGGTEDANNNRITNLAIPTGINDAQKSNHLGLLGNVVTSICANNQLLAYQTSNSTWICSSMASDIDNFLVTLNGDGSAAQTVQGTAGHIKVTNAGATHTIDTSFKINNATCPSGRFSSYDNVTGNFVCSGGTGGITSINSDTTAAQTIAGTANNVTVTNTGATHTFNLGSNVVTTGGQPQVVAKSLTANTLVLGGDENANSHKITSLSNPTLSTDATNAGHLGLLGSLATGICTNGQVIQYQTSNSTWVCRTLANATDIDNFLVSLNGDTTAAQTIAGTAGHIKITDVGATHTIDTSFKINNGTCISGRFSSYDNVTGNFVCSGGTGGITSINSDTTAAQTIAGTANNVTVTNTGATHTFNLGSNVVTTGGQPQVVAKSLTANTLVLGGDENANSHKITSLSNPTLSTDATNAGHLGLLGSLATGICTNGQVIQYQTSNSTWVCRTLANATDTDSFLTQLNSQTGPTITITRGSGISVTNNTNNIVIGNTGVLSITGTTNNVTASASTGAVTLNLGSDVLMRNGVAQTVTKSLTANTLVLGGDENANSHKITSLSNPTLSTDATNAGHLGLLGSLATGTCVNGQVIQYQTSNSTWVCRSLANATDTDTSLTSINSQTGPAITITNGPSNNLKITTTSNTITLDTNNTAQGQNLTSTNGLGYGIFENRVNATKMNFRTVLSDPTITLSTNSTSLLINNTGVSQDASFYHRTGGVSLYSFNIYNAQATTTGAPPTTNKTELYPFLVGKGFAINKIGYELTAIGTSARCIVGIYNDTGSMYPMHLMATGVDHRLNVGDALGMKLDTVTANLLSNHLYWLAINCNGSPTLRETVSTAIAPILGYSVGGGANNQIIGLSLTQNHVSVGFTLSTAFPAGATDRLATTIPFIWVQAK